MGLKRIKINPDKEILILTGMIVSTEVLNQIHPIIDKKFFKSQYSRKIVQWCIDYFNTTGKAPGVHIEDIFKDQSEKITDEESQAIGNILSKLSNEYERADKFNSDYVVQEALKYFKLRNILNYSDTIQDLAESGRVEEADELLSKYNSVDLPSECCCDPLNDEKAVQEAFAQVGKPIMKFGGALGKMMNGDLCRESFVSLMGREKIGKTWNLLEFVIQGAKQRNNVAFFQAGDMSQNQQLVRFHTRISGISHKRKYCGTILIPVLDCLLNQTDECDKKDRACKFGIVHSLDELYKKTTNKEDKWRFFRSNHSEGYLPCSICKTKRYFQGSIWWKIRKEVEPLDCRKAIANGNKFKKFMKGRRIKLATYSNGSLTVAKIQSVLETWISKENFIPDIIVIDYADLLDFPGIKDERDRINKTWMGLRSLSQDYKCLVVTATQADADSYDKSSLGLKNFSNDKRKYAHVTSMYSLNQQPDEKQRGIMRYGSLVVREDDFDIRDQVKVLQCFSIGKAHIASFY